MFCYYPNRQTPQRNNVAVGQVYGLAAVTTFYMIFKVIEVLIGETCNVEAFPNLQCNLGKYIRSGVDL